MRCPDCNKFVAYGDPELELSDEAFDADTLRVTASVGIALTCEQCGTELKTTSLDLEETITAFEAPSETTSTYENAPNDCAHEYELECEEPDPTIETEGKGRGMRTFYGATVECTVTCSKCGQHASVTLSGREQASAFDEA